MSKNKRGFTLLTAVFLVLVFTLLAIAASTFISSASVIAVKNYNSIRAFYIAEAGLRFAIVSSLETSSDWRNIGQFSGDFAGGTFTVQNVSPEVESAILKVTGVYPKSGPQNVRRVIQQGFIRSYRLPDAFSYAVYWRNSSGSTDRLTVGGILFGCDLTGNCFGDGNFSVNSNSSVTGGTIYVSPGHDVNGSGTYTWEVLSAFPSWPLLNNSYYTGLINRYDALIPATAAPAYPYSGSSATITLHGETITYESITIGSAGSLTLYGSGELVSRGDFIVQGSLKVQPNTGEAIALIAHDGMTMSSIYPNSARLYPGTRLYSVNDICRFNKVFSGTYGSVECHTVLIMSKTRVTINWFGSRILDDSIIYIPPSATGSKAWYEPDYYVVDVTLTSTDIFRGSIICDCGNPTRLVKFGGGSMMGIIYSPISPVRLFEANIHGSVVTDKFLYYFNQNNFDADIDWAQSFLPSLPPPGISQEVVSFMPSSWQEIY
ncbi:MAG: pilus assembly PilX N-terminal domain-containing protein [Candidatus Margulisbacteria bacterium]|nr:pilus assembly PilX N-terminal domain-containing protein [Candidatus Margulisiibacteriota bacterium]